VKLVNTAASVETDSHHKMISMDVIVCIDVSTSLKVLPNTSRVMNSLSLTADLSADHCNMFESLINISRIDHAVGYNTEQIPPASTYLYTLRR
jgi:hypothetical protein